MKNFLAKIKAFVAAKITWLCSWPVDLAIRFFLSDNISFIILLIVAPTAALIGKTWPAILLSGIVTLTILFCRKKRSAMRLDWRDIAAGCAGIGWAWVRITLGWLILKCLF